jgi:muramidase (phage lysozyme)
MNDNYFSFSQLFVESALQPYSQRILPYQQIFLQYKQTFSGCFIPPLFILPSFFLDIKYENWRLTSTPKKTKSRTNQNTTQSTDDDIPLPQVDPIATAYANSYVSVQFSLRFIKYVMNPVNHIKMLIADNKYSQEALTYYKSNSLNIKQLEDLISCEERKYRQQLKQVTFTTKRKQANGKETEHTLNLTAKQIDDVISIVKADVDRDYLDSYFKQVKALIIQNAKFTEKEYSPEELVDLPQIRAMLDVINYSEGTGAGYGTIVRGVVKKSPYYPELIGQSNVVITDFSRFPEISVDYGPDWSTAAGRYQINSITWKDFGRGDFSPRSQDMAAVRIMIRENMIEPLLNGNIRQAIFAGGQDRWASFPMDESGRSFAPGQHAKPIAELLGKYNEFLAKY